jgi:hypothetical protein
MTLWRYAPPTEWGINMQEWLESTDPQWIKIADRLRSVIAELDDDFLERIVNAEWGTDTQDCHWYDATTQMMYCIVASYGTPMENFFRDFGIEPHACFLAPEYEKRKKLGVYDTSVRKWDGLNKNFDRINNY